MSVIEEVRREREDLARVLRKHTGIRKIVEDLYPDSAHFIYELLQNAEDTGATEASFVLSDTGLVFEHNGRPFEPADIYAITDIGEGTKGGDEDKIGRFGIGFKAVFAYTETPFIWSPTFAFRIDELVLPLELDKVHGIGELTRFEFPFNSTKKNASDAYTEVLDGLRELSETTLLFLSSITLIRWRIEGKSEGEISKVSHSENHVELFKKGKTRTTAHSHFLYFSESVEELARQHVSIAFELELLPKVSSFDQKKPLKKQFRIIPADPGNVAVFFTAKKETSGLRFHLHAPFVPELSRASIKDTRANRPLFQQLTALAANSLFKIRDLGFLNGEFLAVLPNPHDSIPERYQCFRETIIETMNTKRLTPTYTGNHAPARNLLQAKASLKALLVEKDIRFLRDHDGEGDESSWAIGARQKNSDVDRFLESLDIETWDIDDFVNCLEENLESGFRFTSHGYFTEPSESFTEWLSDKPDEWHQKLYALLYRELEPEYELGRLENLHLVPVGSGDYRVGEGCYFPSVNSEKDDGLPRVSAEIFSSGKNKKEQEDARKLLEALGVREVGEVEYIRAILEERYSEHADVPDLKVYKKDLLRFFKLVEKDESQASLFSEYYIFMGEADTWCRPEDIFLDAPYEDTGLSFYFEVFSHPSEPVALATAYTDLGISLKRFVLFVKSVGGHYQLSASRQSTSSHPLKSELQKDYWERHTSKKIDSDWTIPGLNACMENPSKPLSRLIWKTMAQGNWPPGALVARFRPNAQYTLRNAPSTLALLLRDHAWVPQKSGDFVRPAEASSDLLPDGFDFSSGAKWLKEIQFGEEIQKRTEKSKRQQRFARELGFEDDESFGDAKWFAALGADERRRLKYDYESRRNADPPENDPANPDRRTTRVSDQAADAPDRATEKRTRSVSVGRDAVKKDTDPYLRQQYTNNDGEMICQACQTRLPFKLGDDKYYYESVEFLPELHKRHYQNYLALCPNHAAMFRHANDSRELTMALFQEVLDNSLELVLAGEDVTVYFTKAHIIDLKAVIASDMAEKDS